MQLKQDEQLHAKVQGHRMLLDNAERLGKSLGVPVKIQVGAKGAGKIVISFKDQTELERIEKSLSN